MPNPLQPFAQNTLGGLKTRIHASGYHAQLKALVVPECKTLLDVGCGWNSPVAKFRESVYSVGLDIFDQDLLAAQAARIHNDYVIGDIRLLVETFPARSFDCVVALDLIEHLTSAEGLRLMQHMERIAAKRVIIFTPNGFVPQDPTEENPYQEHKSGWSPRAMRRLGYRVIGIHGLKYFRQGQMKAREPQWLFSRLSFLSQPLLLGLPELAYHILCYKDVA